jgi:predicted DNA binding CopG/RHH family protein
MAPTGGPRDEQAPEIKKQSLNDSSLNFKGGKIDIEFNEFVKLQDIQNQLNITPFTKAMPKVTVRKRRVTIHLHDSMLMPNTTYRMTMGNAIQDIHEGNSYKDLDFTFSTGPYFDSLTLQGICIDASTGMPDTSAYILLYPANVPDSAFMKQKPLYAQKTVQGAFRIEHLPNRDFRIFALQDNPRNYLYDAKGEHIAFYNSLVNPSDTSLYVQLYSFIETDSKDTASRKKMKTIGTSQTTKPETKISYTVNVDTSSKTKRSMDISQALKINCTNKLKDLDQAKIRLFQDDIFDANATITIDTSGKAILLQTEWIQDALYTLKLLKGFAKDSANMQTEAGEFSFRTKKQSDYGYITVLCEKAETNMIELLKGGKVIAQKRASDTSVAFNLLLPDTYQLRILHDKNNNGKWDTGQFFGEKKQPELTDFWPNEITIKANWENKVDLRSRKKGKLK